MPPPPHLPNFSRSAFLILPIFHSWQPYARGGGGSAAGWKARWSRPPLPHPILTRAGGLRGSGSVELVYEGKPAGIVELTAQITA